MPAFVLHCVLKFPPRSIFMLYVELQNSISLQVVEFSELDKGKLKLMKKVLHQLLTQYPDYVLSDVFTRIAPFPKLKMLREGLSLFMNHFLLKSKRRIVKAEENIQIETLKEKIKVAENAMGSSNIDFLL